MDLREWVKVTRGFQRPIGLFLSSHPTHQQSTLRIG
jgi:hypothetical protein